MNKIEFSDVNRFLTSLGLIFIGLAFFLPWFVNQNDKLLILEQEKINKLTPTAKKIIESQQETILIINNFFPYLCSALILLGLVMLTIGIIRWNRRQTISDKIQDEELKSKEIQNLSSQDKRELIANEIEINDPENFTEVETIDAEIDNYIQIENQIYLQLNQAYKNRFTLSQNVKIGDYNYDIILKSRNLETDSDRIVEIKFYKNTITLNNLKDAATQFILATKNYDFTFKRRALPFLIVIYSGTEFDLNLKDYKTKIQDYSKTLGKNLRIKFVQENEIINIKPTEYLRIT